MLKTTLTADRWKWRKWVADMEGYRMLYVNRKQYSYTT